MTARPGSRSFVWTAVSTAVLLLVVLLSGIPAGADTKQELARARARLAELDRRIERQTRAVDALETDAAAIAARMNGVQARIAETQAQIARLQGEIQEANERLAALQDRLDGRAWAAYQSGPGTAFEFLLGSSSLYDLSTRLEIIDRVAASDRALIDEMLDLRAGLRTTQRQQEALKAQLVVRERELRVQQTAILAKLGEAQDLVERLDRDLAEAGRLVKKLKEKRQREIEAARRARLAMLRAAQGSTGGPVVGRPFQVCPVDAPRAYGDDYGAPRYTGGYHPHAGNDIFAPFGTPIRAPFAGTAVDASNGIGGLSVKVYGAAGHVYNAHLSSFGRVGRVSAGDIIGYVGDSGNAAGTPPHNHFEWHPNAIPAGAQSYNGTVNPYPYLNQVC